MLELREQEGIETAAQEVRLQDLVPVQTVEDAVEMEVMEDVRRVRAEGSDTKETPIHHRIRPGELLKEVILHVWLQHRPR